MKTTKLDKPKDIPCQRGDTNLSSLIEEYEIERYQMSSLSMQHSPLFLDNVITSLKLEDTTKDDLCRSYALNYFQTMTQVSPRINKSYS